MSELNGNLRSVTAVGLALVLAGCGAEGDSEGLVARVGDHRLTVDDVVQLLVDEERLPNQADVVQSLADLWIDYTLLADAAQEDTTLASLDLEPLVRQRLEQEIIFQLRDSVIQVDTAMSDAELRDLFDREGANVRLRARHILMGYPDQATEAQRDSVRSAMADILARARAGESFEALARQYSQDPGSAPRGGDLGEFGRGDMVKPFEEAAYALDPGEISDVVETPFGLHIIQLEDRVTPDFESAKDAFRARMRNRRSLEAESTYVAGVEERTGAHLTEDAVILAREVAKNPSARLSGRASRRPLAEWEGGSLTVGELRFILQSQQPQFRANMEQAPDAQIERFLDNLVQRELLVAQAEAAGLAPPQERVDSLVANARGQIRRVADDLGLLHVDVAPGEPVRQGVDRAVREVMEKIVTGARDVIPLGQVTFQLRTHQPSAIFDAGVGQAILKIGQIRASRSPSPAESQVPQAAGPDTAGPGGN